MHVSSYFNVLLIVRMYLFVCPRVHLQMSQTSVCVRVCVCVFPGVSFLPGASLLSWLMHVERIPVPAAFSPPPSSMPTYFPE